MVVSLSNHDFLVPIVLHLFLNLFPVRDLHNMSKLWEQTNDLGFFSIEYFKWDICTACCRHTVKHTVARVYIFSPQNFLPTIIQYLPPFYFWRPPRRIWHPQKGCLRHFPSFLAQQSTALWSLFPRLLHTTLKRSFPLLFFICPINRMLCDRIYHNYSTSPWITCSIFDFFLHCLVLEPSLLNHFIVLFFCLTLFSRTNGFISWFLCIPLFKYSHCKII